MLPRERQRTGTRRKLARAPMQRENIRGLTTVYSQQPNASVSEVCLYCLVMRPLPLTLTALLVTAVRVPGTLPSKLWWRHSPPNLDLPCPPRSPGLLVPLSHIHHVGWLRLYDAPPTTDRWSDIHLRKSHRVFLHAGSNPRMAKARELDLAR